MVKALKRRKRSGARVQSLYNQLVSATQAGTDFDAMFRRFMDLVDFKSIGRPIDDPYWDDLLAAIGQEGLGGRVFTTRPVLMTFESQTPALIYGTAQFETTVIPFFYLPAQGRGVAALITEGEQHYRGFTLEDDATGGLAMAQSSACGCC
jgi:hypothetical protein